MIKIENYSKTIKGRRVLDDINLSMDYGHIYGFKGVNGSGKTMLMRAVAGLIYPSKGRLIIDDRELGKDIHFPESVGILLENPSFLGSYTAFENLKMLASLRNNITDDMISDIIRDVGLDPEDERKYSKFSLGMKQRLGIASALLGSPRIIILDEPFNALDEKGIEQISGLIIKAKESGSLIIMACHDSAELEKLADKLIVIYEGKITDEKDLNNTQI